MTNYMPLKQNDVRQKGDEVRSLKAVLYSGHLGDASADWRPTNLIGNRILPIDLSHLEFRRSVK